MNRSITARTLFSLRRNRAAWRKLRRALARNQKGAAAIEFTILLPVMLVAYLGTVDVGQGLMVDRKVTALNRALADLTGQISTVSNTDISNIFDAATTVMMPFTGVAPAMTVSQIIIDDKSNVKVCWSETRNGSALGRGSAVTIPDALKVPNTSLIMATTTYNYAPLSGYVLKSNISIGGFPIYVRPRLGKVGGTLNIEQIERSGVAMCPPFT